MGRGRHRIDRPFVVCRDKPLNFRAHLLKYDVLHVDVLHLCACSAGHYSTCWAQYACPEIFRFQLYAMQIIF